MTLREAIVHGPTDPGDEDPITIFAARIGGQGVPDSPAVIAPVSMDLPIDAATPSNPPGLEYFLEAAIVHEIRAQIQRRHGSGALPDDVLVRGTIYYAENDAPPPDFGIT